MLRNKQAQKLAGHIHGHVLHGRVGAHKDEAARLEHVREHARGSAAHGAAEQDDVLLLETEAALTLGCDHVVEEADGAFFYFFGVGREFPLGDFLINYLVTEKPIPRILHAHDRVVEVVLDIVQEVQIIKKVLSIAVKVNYYSLALILIAAKLRDLFCEVLLYLQQLHLTRLAAAATSPLPAALLLTVVLHKLLRELLLLQNQFFRELVDIFITIIQKNSRYLILDLLAILAHLVNEDQHFAEFFILRLEEEVHVARGLRRRVHDRIQVHFINTQLYIILSLVNYFLYIPKYYYKN